MSERARAGELGGGLARVPGCARACVTHSPERAFLDVEERQQVDELARHRVCVVVAVAVAVRGTSLMNLRGRSDGYRRPYR